MSRCIRCGKEGQGIVCRRCSRKTARLVEDVKKESGNYVGVVALAALGSLVGYKAIQHWKERSAK
ncbi:MAG: hypothetical protein PHQ83_00505 [Eubacteriales bacterium]|nr:hypothetical protein [Eubacteriales bacterium]